MTLNLEFPNPRIKTGLIVVAHADDLLLFCGAVALALIEQGWDIHVVRVTDDCWDSWGLDAKETARQNKREFDEVISRLRVHSLYEFNYPTDSLGDESEVELRNRLVKVIRQVKPYLVMSFDPNSIKFEDNQDHILVANAVAEACWTAGFDKHPDGKVDHLTPHLPIERWFFGRTVMEVTHSFDIEPFHERLIELIAIHKTMLGNMIAQSNLQANFLGYSLEKLQSSFKEDPTIFASLLIQERGAEKYRVIGPEKINFLIKEFGEYYDF